MDSSQSSILENKIADQLAKEAANYPAVDDFQRLAFLFLLRK